MYWGYEVKSKSEGEKSGFWVLVELYLYFTNYLSPSYVPRSAKILAKAKTITTAPIFRIFASALAVRCGKHAW